MNQSSPESSAKETQLTMDKELCDHWVGLMPVAEFLDEFMPVHQADLPPDLPNLFGTMPETKIEIKLYDPFVGFAIRSLQDHASLPILQQIKLVSEDHNLIPGFKIVNTSDYPDQNSRKGKRIKPDPTMYKEDVDTTRNVTQFDKLELHFEFKPKGSTDPFRDPKPDISPEERLAWQFVSDSQSSQHCRGQLATYATEWCTRQHRVFAFSVFIYDPYVRFIRWDRSGIVVTERFNFRTNSQPLVDFLWRFVHLTDVQRGRDNTVREATAEEIQLAHEHLTQWKNVKERPVIVFYIQDGDIRREFIGWGSMADAESLLGRATRAYPVYEKASGEIRFLKDSWRAASLEQESQTLRTLNAAGVRNVPVLDCGGDIEHHVTRSHIFGAEDPPNCRHIGVETLKRNSWKCGKHRIVERIHHRFTSKFVGVHLENFTTSKKLMQAVYDAFLGKRNHTLVFQAFS
jgi:Fungal protein kinase